MSDILRTISPVDGSVYVERELSGASEIDNALNTATAAQKSWRLTSVEDRCKILTKAIDYFVENKAAVGEELTWQMGRPISQAQASSCLRPQGLWKRDRSRP